MNQFKKKSMYFFFYIIISVDRFKVGNDLEIYVEVRPRSLSGVLLAVHGAMDFLVLQMVNGEVLHL